MPRPDYTSVDKAILAAIKNSPGARIRCLAGFAHDSLNESRAEYIWYHDAIDITKARLQHLRKQGKIVANKGGRWSLAEKKAED
jgi:hypothetical protein